MMIPMSFSILLLIVALVLCVVQLIEAGGRSWVTWACLCLTIALLFSVR